MTLRIKFLKESKTMLNETKIIEKNAGLIKRKRQRPPKFMVIHHTGTNSPSKTLRIWVPRGSRRASTHFEIDKDGTIYQYLDPAKWIAAHTPGANDLSIGIDLTGNFSTHHKGPEAALTAEEAGNSPQWQSLKVLVNKLSQQFNIPLTVAPSKLRRTQPETIISNNIGITRHKNFRATACPGTLPLDLLGTPFEGEMEFTIEKEEDVPSRETKQTQGKKLTKKLTKKIKLKKRKRFFSNYRIIEKQGLTFEQFYRDLEETFGSGWIREMLPKYRDDKLFGPEHYAALKKLAKNISDPKKKEFYKSLIKTKEKARQNPKMKKAEKKAEKKMSTGDKETDRLMGDAPGVTAKRGTKKAGEKCKYGDECESGRCKGVLFAPSQWKDYTCRGGLEEQTEPFQKKVKKRHHKMKIRLIGKGNNTYNIGGKMKKPSYKRSKSAPSGFGGT